MNLYDSQDAMVKYMQIPWSEIDKLDFFRYQLSLKNIEKMIKDEQRRQSEQDRKQKEEQRSQQNRYKMQMPKFK